MSPRADGTTPGPATPTLASVAQAAGVSRATASRAFGNPRVLRPETVARVHAAARDLGYVPNPAAKALSTGRHGLLAVIVPDIANPFFPPLIGSVEGRADTAGLAVLLGNSAEDPAREHLLMNKLGLQVDGFVLAASRLSDEQIRTHAARRPVILVNRDLPGLPRVLIDTAAGVTEAVEHLAALGHSHLAYLSGPARSWANSQRRKAFRRTAERLGVEPSLLPARISSYAAGQQAVPGLLASGVTAVVAFDDLLAHGVLAGLAEHQVAVPDEFSVVGCDDVMASQTYPPLTTVSARASEAGATAVDLLTQRLEQGARAASDVRVLLDTSLVVRATTAPRP
ncbi:LacI family DNA-binding transcriptional regulator [Streptomyces sp. NPDC050560]|uniref:LacI family DNA-binding transcriptional regulator n=1 Tax=Streptomyces sp. NPDC050560 TaxID=3365630 RepID=UPI0037B80A54